MTYEQNIIFSGRDIDYLVLHLTEEQLQHELKRATLELHAAETWENTEFQYRQEEKAFYSDYIEAVTLALEIVRSDKLAQAVSKVKNKNSLADPRDIKDRLDIVDVIGLDIENKPGITLRADNWQLPIRDRSIDVVVYDPPHLTDQATSTGREKFIGRYGDAGYHANCSYLFPEFLKESDRVLKFPGLLICKMIDTVNRRKQEFQHVDFIEMARAQGFSVVDMIIKVRKNPAISGAWKTNIHARKCHSYFIICRRRRTRS